jgi:signal transduction histidine kinase
VKSVLLLFEGYPSTPAYKPLLDGIGQKLKEAYGDEHNMHIEFLNFEKLSSADYPKSKFDLINEKYRNITLDLLICYGKKALEILNENADSHLLNLPTITTDLDFSKYGYPLDLNLNKKTLRVGLKFNIEKTILSALELFPAASSIYFISGVSAFDKRMLSVSVQAANAINTGKDIKVINDLSMDEILKRVRVIPDNSLIFIPVFVTDNNLVPYYNPEAIKLISHETKVPVIILSDMGMGNGSIGGYLLSFSKAGLFIGKSAIDILNGKEPNLITVSESDYYEYIFDWRELKRLNLLGSKSLPEGSKILFEEIKPMDKYKWFGGVGLLFIVLQSILIAALIKLNKRQKLMTQKIIDTESRYNRFLHEDRSLRLGQLTASLSHELNQPFTAILSNAQAGINFINSNQATPELLKEIFQKIVDNDKRGASVLSSIRGMLKLEIREKEKTDLNYLIEEVVTVFEGEASKLSTKLFVQLKDTPIYVLADKIQIQQVILNLIFNASQSMERSDTKNKTIDITQSVNDEDIVVSIRDYGNGIDESILAKVFNPFVTSRSEGMGIGLPICRSIIEDHGGKIWAENLPEGGAKFSFSLKMMKDE